jgi:hypothetical protein
VKVCRVSFKDLDGTEHAVEVEAESLYEAVGLAIARFRKSPHIENEPGREFLVEPREPSTQHRVGRKQFDDWLSKPGGSPKDVYLRGRLLELLDGNKPPLLSRPRR